MVNPVHVSSLHLYFRLTDYNRRLFCRGGDNLVLRHIFSIFPYSIMLIMAEVRTDMCKEHPGKEIERLIRADRISPDKNWLTEPVLPKNMLTNYLPEKTILQKAWPENPVKSLLPSPKVPAITAKMPDTDRNRSMIITFTSWRKRSVQHIRKIFYSGVYSQVFHWYRQVTIIIKVPGLRFFLHVQKILFWKSPKEK